MTLTKQNKKPKKFQRKKKERERKYLWHLQMGMFMFFHVVNSFIRDPITLSKQFWATNSLRLTEITTKSWEGLGMVLLCFTFLKYGNMKLVQLYRTFFFKKKYMKIQKRN